MLKWDRLEDVGSDDVELSRLLENGQSQSDSPDLESMLADPDPDYGRIGLEDRLFPEPDTGKPTSTPRRVTQAVRKDIRAKIAMLLTIFGSTLAARDEPCGTALMDAVADSEEDERVGIATALTDIVCDSPDLVGWFTTSGKYMKWLSLAVSVQPVITTAFHHHVTHLVGQQIQQADDWSQYGSG